MNCYFVIYVIPNVFMNGCNGNFYFVFWIMGFLLKLLAVVDIVPYFFNKWHVMEKWWNWEKSFQNRDFLYTVLIVVCYVTFICVFVWNMCISYIIKAISFLTSTLSDLQTNINHKYAFYKSPTKVIPLNAFR